MNQGIVPVPKGIGNGQDPKNNLYWGCGYGIKTYFKNSKEWTLVETYNNPTDIILERAFFKHKTTNTYLLADAYDGKEIKQTTLDFLYACNAAFETEVTFQSSTLKFGGKSNLVAYIGHNGLMDFHIEPTFQQNDKEIDAIILACASQKYFAEYLFDSGANPLVWTTNLMAPEAYTIKWSIDVWLLNQTDAQVAEKAAEAYNHYQNCGIKAARRLLVTGW